MAHVAGLALAGAWAAPAAARTLVVDDGVPTCGDARYHSIGAAVGAAGAGDTINVCAGTYHEDVNVERDRIKLFSRTRHGAVVKGQVTLVGTGVHMRGFTVSGPTPAGGFGCDGGTDPNPVGVNVAGLRVTVDYTRITDIHPADCADEGTAMLIQPQGPLGPKNAATAAHNTIDGYGGLGIKIGHRFDGGYANVHDNRVTDPAGSGAEGIFVECCVATLQHNTVEGNPGTGIRANGGEDRTFGVRIEGNRVRDNGAGIFVDFLGFGVESVTVHSRVIRNLVTDNRGDGIHYSRSFDFKTLFKDNRSLGNGGLDCLDGSDERATWVNNTGVTDAPNNICRPPR